MIGPTAGIVIIGDEILTGKFGEENAVFLIGELRALGVELRRITVIPDDLDALLTRDRTAAALSEGGFPTSPKTLATMATRGGGPRFHRFGRCDRYPVGPRQYSPCGSRFVLRQER